jgi:hypothetical protein
MLDGNEIGLAIGQPFAVPQHSTTQDKTVAVSVGLPWP